MSSGEGANRKWADTELQGSLEIAEIGKDDLENAQIRLVAIDNLNVRRGILMEYELPFNFVFKPKQTDIFSSIQLMGGQHIGFLFDNDRYRLSFDDACLDLQKQMKKSEAQIKSMAQKNNGAAFTDFSKKIGTVVNAKSLFGGSESDKNEEVFKLLQVLGIDPKEAMGDPVMEAKIKEIVNNFDPNKKFSDEDKAFAVRNAKFSHTNKQKIREDRT